MHSLADIQKTEEALNSVAFFIGNNAKKIETAIVTPTGTP